MPLTLNDLSKLAEHPLRLLKSGGELGITVARKSIPTILLFGFINFVAIVTGIVQLVIDYRNAITGFTLILLVAALAMVFVFYNSYRYIRAQLTMQIYLLTADNLVKFASSIANAVKEAAPTAAVNKVVNVTNLATDAYGKLPGPLKRLMVFMLSQIPILKIIQGPRQHALAQTAPADESKTFQLIDTNIKAYLNEELGMARAWMFLFGNVLIHIYIIFWLM